MKELTTNQEQVQLAEDQEPMPEDPAATQGADKQRKLRCAYCK